MTDMTDITRQHYSANGLTGRIREALSAIASEDRIFKATELAALDHFHTRGLLATQELAALTPIGPSTRVLDLGCGIGGPARFLAEKYACKVIGVDLSADFIEAATYLTARCGLSKRVSFQVADALQLPFDAAAFDLVFLQHVAMNISDRAALYAEVGRVLAPSGLMATYDVIMKSEGVHYPTPWARDAAASCLLTEAETHDALVAAKLNPLTWQDQSSLAMTWFAGAAASAPPKGPTLALVLGRDFATLTGNLGRNLAEDRVGILAAVAQRMNEMS